MILRPYQTDAILRCRQVYAGGKRRVVLQVATGGGKTLIAAEVVRSAQARGSRILFTTHRKEIHKQTCAKLAAAGVQFDELTAGKVVPAGQIIVASQQTLARRAVPAVDLVIVDEAHSGIEQQKRLMEALPGARFLLLTATPCRTDGKPLPADEIVSGPSMRELISMSHLVPARVFGVESPDLAGIPVRNGEYDAHQLETAYRRTRLIGQIPENWLRLCAGRRTILFASGVEHSKECKNALLMRGIRAEHVDGSTPDAERAGIWERLRRHELDVVCNVGVAIEGLDVPEVSAVYLARATQSLTVYLQAIGRGMRPGGSDDLVVVDAGANVWRHGLPEDDRQWSLTEKAHKPAYEELKLGYCKVCLAVFPVSPVCPRCGQSESAPAARRPPEIVAGELKEITQAELDRQERRKSMDTPPRPCPSWAAPYAYLWHGLEKVRHRKGYALGNGSRFSGWTAAQIMRKARA